MKLFKMWFATLGRERFEEIYDPSRAILRLIQYYHRLGYTDARIKTRLKTIINRHKLTDAWKSHGIEKKYG